MRKLSSREVSFGAMTGTRNKTSTAASLQKPCVGWMRANPAHEEALEEWGVCDADRRTHGHLGEFLSTKIRNPGVGEQAELQNTITMQRQEKET